MSSERYESDDVDIEPLRQSLTFAFSGRTAKNRLMKAAMEERLATWDAAHSEKRGIPTPELVELYRRWGEQPDGWGVIVTGNFPIEFDQPANYGDAIITPECPFEGKRFEAFKALASAAKAQGSLIIGQLNHPGRQVRDVFTKDPISASDVVLKPEWGGAGFARPRPATAADIARVVDGFAHGARYLEAAGFDGVNLHAAHGYLLAQFLSARTNRRDDAYGGDAARRRRLLLEVVAEIRRRVANRFVVSVKLNSTDFQDDGFQPAEARELVAALQDCAVDFVELSGGTYERLGHEWTSERTRRREAFFLDFAEAIVPGLQLQPGGGSDGDSCDASGRKTKVFITGGLRSAGAMARALGVVDGVGLARPASAEPHLAADLLRRRVPGARRPLPPFENSAALGNRAAGVQMRQLAAGMQPFDLGDEADVRDYWASVAAWDEADDNSATGEGRGDGADDGAGAGGGRRKPEERIGYPAWKGSCVPCRSGVSPVAS